MKRFRFLLLFLVLSLLVGTASAADAAPAGSIRTSRFAQCAPMSEYRALFTETERAGATLTRAQTAVILARLAGAEETSPAAPVSSDVSSDAWYASGVRWAVEHQILSLAEDGLFYPDIPIDRQGLSLALCAFLEEEHCTLRTINPWYSFMDAGSFSKAGRQAAALMQEAGVMIEGFDGCFYPGYGIPVSEAESIFLRFIAAMERDSFLDLPVSSVAESAPVDNSWFDDACFIGHSQVVGMSMYFDLPARYYSVVGFKAQDILDFQYFQGPDRSYDSIREILEKYDYGKVYIMLGINDCDIADDRIEQFLRPMRELMDLVTKNQPNATVYLLSLAPVGRETPLNIAYNPENAMLYSRAIKSLSREYGAEYLDLYRLMCDEEGYFLDEFNSGDGIHIKANQYSVIEDFLKCHTVA